uniref:Uncharacterized protein n=1 Tax=Arundo donax TaxID=35708 RepID=A0A0A9A5G5_ARUDO
MYHFVAFSTETHSTKILRNHRYLGSSNS